MNLLFKLFKGIEVLSHVMIFWLKTGWAEALIKIPHSRQPIYVLYANADPTSFMTVHEIYKLLVLTDCKPTLYFYSYCCTLYLIKTF